MYAPSFAVKRPAVARALSPIIASVALLSFRDPTSSAAHDEIHEFSPLIERSGSACKATVSGSSRRIAAASFLRQRSTSVPDRESFFDFESAVVLFSVEPLHPTIIRDAHRENKHDIAKKRLDADSTVNGPESTGFGRSQCKFSERPTAFRLQ